MKKYNVEDFEFEAATKKEAVLMYEEWYFNRFMYKCEKRFNTIYRSAYQIITV